MTTLLELAASIVESHASTTEMTTDDLLLEIQKVYQTLKALCIICGKGGMKTLARHLSQTHGMKPGEYRKQFGIPKTQALAAKSFSESRRKMALERNLAGNLEKAREVRMANIQAKKA
ncbi:MAG: transcriptional regulator, MucR family [Firmicutes bacterium]|nr:transcriptional regulator, MucR family [Bacillota bacterium]